MSPALRAEHGLLRRCLVLLNGFEKLMMNNPLRAAYQRWQEAGLLSRLAPTFRPERVLEIGCGRGVGVEIIFEHFHAARVDAVDLDPDMLERARTRLERRYPERVQLALGDVTQLPAAAATYDAVFDFGTLHHVPDWPSALNEIYRVLRPGGLLLFMEVTRLSLEGWFSRTLYNHPSENRFSADDLLAALPRAGLHVDGRCRLRRRGHYLYGVAVRDHDPSPYAMVARS